MARRVRKCKSRPKDTRPKPQVETRLADDAFLVTAGELRERKKKAAIKRRQPPSEQNDDA